jgi:TetR/AcrR family transcriptional regulator
VKNNRRLGMENARSRNLLIEAADDVLIEEGAHAVSARRVAERAGLKPQLVHYYFQTMDDLLIAVFRRAQQDYLGRHEQALGANHPLDALWKLNNEPRGTRRMMGHPAAVRLSAQVDDRRPHHLGQHRHHASCARLSPG